MISMELQAIAEVWEEALRPPPILSVDEWADEKRILTFPEPGDYRTSRTPYLREIMYALSPLSPTRQVNLVKGTQLGGTEVAYNLIGFSIDHSPCPIMLIMPTKVLGKRVSKQRIDPMIKAMPCLSSKVVAPWESPAPATATSSEICPAAS